MSLNKINLVIQYFKYKTDDEVFNQNRQTEIDYCLKKNVENNLIDKIHILTEEYLNIDFVSNEKIIQIVINKRLEYNDVFEYYNENLSNEICILSNADIYFDNSLSLLNYINFDLNVILCLNRYEDDNDNDLKLMYGKEKKPYKSLEWAQDVWIWKRKNLKINNSNFWLGIPGCDNHIAFLFYQNKISL